MHILYTDEANRASDLLPNGGYVMVPMKIDELDQNNWQKFFKDIVDFSKFLISLDWKRDSLIIVLFNEPNQAGEWGGEINPKEYGEMLSFAVLPAALDMAADGKNR